MYLKCCHSIYFRRNRASIHHNFVKKWGFLFKNSCHLCFSTGALVWCLHTVHSETQVTKWFFPCFTRGVLKKTIEGRRPYITSILNKEIMKNNKDCIYQHPCFIFSTIAFLLLRFYFDRPVEVAF